MSGRHLEMFQVSHYVLTDPRRTVDMASHSVVLHSNAGFSLLPFSTRNHCLLWLVAVKAGCLLYHYSTTLHLLCI